jgi:hypothetical protein
MILDVLYWAVALTILGSAATLVGRYPRRDELYGWLGVVVIALAALVAVLAVLQRQPLWLHHGFVLAALAVILLYGTMSRHS